MSSAITAVVVAGAISANQQEKQRKANEDAAAKAQGYQDAGQKKALEQQQAQYDQTRADTAVQRRVGDESLNYLSGALEPGGEFAPQQFQMGDFTADPGYDFRLQQGAQARGNALGAQGMKLSGRAQKELERYGQDYGSQEYGNVYGRQFGEFQQGQNDKQNYLARQMQLAGYGGQGISTAASAGTNLANQNQANYLNTAVNQANIATNTGANTANIQGQTAANYNQIIQGGMQNYLAQQQQNKQRALFNNQMSNSNAYSAGDAYGPSTDYYGRR